MHKIPSTKKSYLVFAFKNLFLFKKEQYIMQLLLFEDS